MVASHNAKYRLFSELSRMNLVHCSSCIDVEISGATIDSMTVKWKPSSRPSWKWSCFHDGLVEVVNLDLRLPRSISLCNLGLTITARSLLEISVSAANFSLFAIYTAVTAISTLLVI
ncbi:hypothetical protein TIFTF001_032753 [Ficus carica]|uniref:Uncharacterized protein n=1 Tax=Ficus carica TaxID=3494 RepID=A0AA88J692_FICCA|nr:hypothetical protein TIFTF001_032753 [Ficus carica]